ncbi:hypothetical protein BTZ20_3356 [Rhodococcus sp. MTM3W5.2]|uniref:hypothetical protein n=1 Tax=Rhodococcus sp. MTM3W5.2 TaxID=1805827 RepID=UPI00097975AE|nr:hypothetical protein [Rhodococcus sp. MTM3W5.2]AQA23089.1 hypothetical protein BTZ20_3356 [Rhodococcus sp. MTM3W5.2]
MSDDGNWRARGLTLSADASAGSWLAEGVRNFDYDVGSLVPVGFEAYARVFHPAARHSGTRYDDCEPVTWRAVAEANGTTPHPAMEWGSITGSWRLQDQAGVWNDEPRKGRLPVAEVRLLAKALRPFTTAAESCWFALWEGFNAVDVPADVERLAMPGRPMIVFTGPLTAADARFSVFDESPSLWWPEDRAWCVATDVDLMTTYVGGTHGCIDAIVGDPDLEALAVLDTQRVTWDSDTVNPLPAPPR